MDGLFTALTALAWLYGLILVVGLVTAVGVIIAVVRMK